MNGGEYTVRLAVYGPPGERHELCCRTDFEGRKDPLARQELLDRIAARLAGELGRKMFPDYRPSAVEEVSAELARLAAWRRGKADPG